MFKNPFPQVSEEVKLTVPATKSIPIWEDTADGGVLATEAIDQEINSRSILLL